MMSQFVLNIQNMWGFEFYINRVPKSYIDDDNPSHNIVHIDVGFNTAKHNYIL